MRMSTLEEHMESQKLVRVYIGSSTVIGIGEPRYRAGGVEVVTAHQPTFKGADGKRYRRARWEPEFESGAATLFPYHRITRVLIGLTPEENEALVELESRRY